MAQQQAGRTRRSAQTPIRSLRNARPTASYRELSSEVELQSGKEEDRVASNLLSYESSNTKPSLHTEHQKPLSKVRGRSSQSCLMRKKRRLEPSDSISNMSAMKATYKRDLYKSTTIPPWTSLPYEVLFLIFQYASYPLCDDRTFQPLPSVDQLVKISRLCRAFAEPALTALYRSPPLVPMGRAHKLRNLLVADPVPMSYNYRAKIERLQIEVFQTAAYTLPGSGLLDLHGLIFHCPRLLDLELYHEKDFAPYNKLHDPIRWTYPDSLFIALSLNVSGEPTRLRSWRWNSRLAGKKRPVESLLEIHQAPSFNGLRKIAFVNYHNGFLRRNGQNPHNERLLADSLAVLPHLEHLIFESSTIVDHKILPLLPKKLKHLEIINCMKIDSHTMMGFLISHGSQLQTLTLNYNYSLQLSFLKVLGSSCPKLESISMNMMHYNLGVNSSLGYGVLLSIDEKPDWPASLRTIELTHLRKWDVDTAKMFFQSILEKADSLVNLRRVTINAALNTSWRDRSSFRDKWVGAFQRVFKRKSDPPNPHLRSLGAYAVFKNKNEISRNAENDTDDDTLSQPSKTRQLSKDGHENSNRLGTRNQTPLTMNMRRSARHSAFNLKVQGDQSDLQDIHSSSSKRAGREHAAHLNTKRKKTLNREVQSLRKSAGMVEQRRGFYNDASQENTSSESVSDSDDVPLVSRRQGGKANKVEHIQGMCDMVSITIDNLRPTENQFVEADFLDSEPSGDEDWDGDNREEEDGGKYAW